MGSARAPRAVFRALAENLERTKKSRTFWPRPRAERLDARHVQPHPRAGVLPISVSGFNPNSEVGWGAHAPRVRFSAPSRKTSNARKSPECFGRVRAQRGWTHGTSSHTRGRVCSPISVSGFNPNSEVEWGAHAPRVPFSAPSRKTSNARKSPERFGRVRAQRGWTRGTSSHTRGRVCSQFRSSGLTQNRSGVKPKRFASSNFIVIF